MGRIVFNDEIVGEIDNGQLPMDNYAAVNYVDRVSCKEIISYLPDGTSRSFPLTMPVAQLNCQLSTVNCQLKKVVLVDCGVKTNIIRCLLKRGVEVIRVPWDYDFNGLEFDGLFISNGRVTRIPATQLYRISARRWRTKNFPSLEFAWATSCSRKPEGQRFTNLNMDTVATTSRYAWWVRNVVLLLRRIMVMR